ncbi:hypothetical protein BX659_101151 [Orenia metallireducens]|uniref:LPP20 lipoprotein n=1 Tax=Orenia metallireducens TaxID=1413210 RepID=A0A285FVZ3_9FIRM|nr:hypothetical protein [Orenia metallireducens]PRX35657.1 hypothetical protein BX659_101151 [Orenia metallireducens]SNY15457.1 hypothetical protein SAMN06265827_10339 [Orenia metallireducens]
MSKRINILLITVMILLMMTQFSFAEGLFDEDDNTVTDWEKSVVKATGYGVAPDYITNEAQAKIMAREAAITMAQRRLLETIKGVQIDSEQTVKNAQVQSDIINKRVSGMVKGAQIIEEKKVADNVYQVIVQVKFYGKDGIMKAIFPSISEESTETSDNNDSSDLDFNNDSHDYNNSEEVDTLVQSDYTGVIINTLNIDAKPALAPKVYDESGSLVYGISKIQSDGVITQGIVGYNRSLADAKANPRVGKNPLIINAIEAKGRYGTDLVLSQKDARTLDQVGRSNGVFNNCKVVIVLN